MYNLDTLNRERLVQSMNGFRMKPYYGKMPPNPFLKDLQIDVEKPTHVGPPLPTFKVENKSCVEARSKLKSRAEALKNLKPCGGTLMAQIR